jgi:dolichyl-phosphate-mannose-protein mannosyltransferase
MNIKRWRPELIGLIVAAFATRLMSLFTPNAVVFDEVYFKAFAAHYLDGRYYFDIHPPLGKLILAGFAHLIGLAPDAMLNGTAVGLRLIPAIAGMLLVPVVWGILRRLGASRPFAFLGALLILLDNALVVESRFILMDSMLLLFGLGGIYFYLVARDTTTKLRWLWLALAAVSAGAAMSIKWTGLSSLGVIGLVWLWDQPNRKVRHLHRLGELLLFALIPIVIYLGSFWLHFKLLPLSGDGDAFMLPRFQATLIGNSQYDPTVRLDFIDKFAQLNYEMYQANQTLTATHPYGSHWYSWPLEQRPVYYWQGDTLPDGRQGNIYLLGNPIIWWGVWIAITTGIGYAIIKRHHLRPVTVASLALTSTAYLINFVPFMAVPRVMFLYHYFFSFIFSLMCAVLLWNDLATSEHHHQLKTTDSRRTFGLVIGLVVVGFLFFAPLTYGIPLTPGSLQTHMWLPSWR